MGGVKGALLGLGCGVLLSSCAGLVLWLAKGQPAWKWDLFLEGWFPRGMQALTPSLLEEAGLRGCLVFLLAGFWGQPAALVAGSLAYGLMYYAGLFTAQPLGPLPAACITLVGLCYAEVYLCLGLGAAVACHLAWGFLAPSWVKMIGLSAPMEIEGSWPVLLALGVVTGLLWVWKFRVAAPAVKKGK